MSDYSIDMRDVRFNLYEFLDMEKMAALPHFAELEHGKELYDMVLDEGYKVAKEVISPLNEPGDREGVHWEDGKVTTPEGYKAAYDKFCEGNWVSPAASVEWGGIGLPGTVAMAVSEMFTGACVAFMIQNGLTVGAADLVAAYGTDEVKSTYLPNMNAGIWAGTMCLTEENAGSDVGACRTKAVKQEDHYLLEGTKIFISAGDQDLTDNIIHLVLARTPGAPKGTKGLSLFLVPKLLVNNDGSLGEWNGVRCSAIEEKMGIHGSPTCVLDFGTDGTPCKGFILGEEGQGMKLMFHMMNDARLYVGVQGFTLAAASYREALGFAKERLQGSHFTQFKNEDAPRVPIIQHPDVQRMLLYAKAYTEAMRALVYSSAYYSDMAKHAEKESERAIYDDLLEIMTPICKAWCTDMGFRVTETCLQVYGGYGYCQEYPAEQYMRDAKIASIYEGTNGIQALDLMGRKVAGKGGLRFMQVLQLLNTWVAKNKDHETLGGLVKAIDDAKNKVAEVTFSFQPMMKKAPAVLLSNATTYLQMFGDMMGGYFIVGQALVADAKLKEIVERRGANDDEAYQKLVAENPEANFYHNKVQTARFYVARILPTVDACLKTMKAADDSFAKVVFA